MTRTTVWFVLVAGGVICQAVAVAFGGKPSLGAIFDAAYWSGAALMVHWLGNLLLSSSEART